MQKVPIFVLKNLKISNAKKDYAYKFKWLNVNKSYFTTSTWEI